MAGDFGRAGGVCPTGKQEFLRKMACKHWSDENLCGHMVANPAYSHLEGVIHALARLVSSGSCSLVGLSSVCPRA